MADDYSIDDVVDFINEGADAASTDPASHDVEAYLEIIRTTSMSPQDYRIALEAIFSGHQISNEDGRLVHLGDPALTEEQGRRIDNEWLNRTSVQYAKLTGQVENPSQALRKIFSDTCVYSDPRTIEAVVFAMTQEAVPESISITTSGDVLCRSAEGNEQILHRDDFTPPSNSNPGMDAPASDTPVQDTFDNPAERTAVTEEFLKQERTAIENDHNTQEVIERILREGVRFATSKGVFFAAPVGTSMHLHAKDGSIVELNEAHCLFRDVHGEITLGDRIEGMDFSPVPVSEPSQNFTSPRPDDGPVADEPSTKAENKKPENQPTTPGSGFSFDFKMGLPGKKPGPDSSAKPRIPGLSGSKPNLGKASTYIITQLDDLVGSLSSPSPDPAELQARMTRVKEFLDGMRDHNLTLSKLPNFEDITAKMESVSELAKNSKLLIAGDKLRDCAAIKAIGEAVAKVVRAMTGPSNHG